MNPNYVSSYDLPDVKRGKKLQKIKKKLQKNHLRKNKRNQRIPKNLMNPNYVS